MKTVGLMGHNEKKYLENYSSAIEAAGLQVRLLVMEEPYVLEGLDALVITGGVDLNPALYNEANTASMGVHDALDRFEMEMIERILPMGIPILGICRGHQILNVYFGGSLIQDVPHTEVHMKDGQKDRSHLTRCSKDSFLKRIYGREEIWVNSAHHQAVGVIGKGFVPVQYTEDGIIEAMQHESLPIYTVQWHPERMCLKYSRPDTESGLEVFRFLRSLCEADDGSRETEPTVI